MSLSELLPLIVPLVIIQMGLIAFTLRNLMYPGQRVKGGNIIVWAMVIILFEFFGPLVYLLAGREET